MHRLLGEIKITEQADKGRQDSSGILAIKRIEQFAYLLMYRLAGTLGCDTLGHETFGHEHDLSKPGHQNQFGKRRGKRTVQVE